MNSERIAQLKNLLETEPNDPFYTYALALEYLHTNRLASLDLLKSLLASHPHYLPTYYQAGLLQIQMGNSTEAEQVLEKGIKLARQTNEVKALNELRSLLESI